MREDKLLSNYEPINTIENYKDFLQENAQIKLIKEKTRTGREPCGDDDFYDKIKLLTGIDYKNKEAGRPTEVVNAKLIGIPVPRFPRFFVPSFF
ncbi:MAG: hypothetical protein Q9M40_12060 [Sulfurimonas sp.]|nr:hypothetical protein [Sulfurimonas sp.]